jgi:hypothetical protein
MDEVCYAFSMRRRNKVYETFWLENVIEGDHEGDFNLDRRIILKRILEEQF